MFRKSLRGGVHPTAHKALSNTSPIRRFPLPQRLHISMQQHLGTPATPVVRVGDQVLKGQLIGASQGHISAPVHAPTSGRITAIAEHTAPHPSGLPVLVVTLECDGRDQWQDTLVVADPYKLAPEEVCVRVGAAGIVGLGGATFPAAVKLGLSLKTGVDTLILNGGECEPYLTCDDRLMRESATDVIQGALLMQHAVQARQVFIGIEDNKPEALQIMQTAAAGTGIEVRAVPSRYPMGSEKQLVQQLTGKELPAMSRAADSGLLVHNVATARAVYQAIVEGRPLISRVVTLSGGAVTHPGNWEVPLGTLASELMNHASGFDVTPARLIMGGPMMGIQLPNLHVPIIKGTSGILALTSEEIQQKQPEPCVRCATCVRSCPMGLQPLEMAAAIRSGNVKAAASLGLHDCVGCGACSYICPSSIPLVHLFNYAKGELAAQTRARQKMENTRVLAQRREERLERQAREREALMAARRAEAARKAAAQAAEEQAS
ncbi:electron transport complex subunit RsxC [Marinospirillum alkaliphilum]|uniref:Ion-translocating oxidoreductase complex subunit C n=1 Tax=Marinospirillum alkaliphilum DSM 21637 TaxID=1122209 RepID=A0A1K1TAM1_9GAMM|nr:electron transport complex subunit RsxC [Marinospirillum alkaliphilum]SFW97614.1 electron transport complex protein RnfC [Marinospirillum alkaliphilum DSM 21637]